MRTIQILEKEDTIEIIIDGKLTDILKSELRAIRFGSNDASDWVIHLSERQGFNSKQHREELLLPLARLMEKNKPHVINWFNTFKEVEGILNHNAESNYNFGNTEDDAIEVDEFIDDALSNIVGTEVDIPETDNFIKNYLTANNLPFV